MANWWDGNHHNNDGGNDVDNTILTRVEILDFCDENQQFHDLIQQNLDRIQETLPPYLLETLIVMMKSEVII